MTETAEKPKTKAERFDLSDFGITVEAPRSMTDKFSSVVFAGKGIGKTSLVGSTADVPAWSPVLIAATEDGSSVLGRDYGDNPNIGVVPITDWPTLADLVMKVSGALYDEDGNLYFTEEPPTPVRTFCIDTISEAQELMKAFTKEAGYGLWAYIADNTINIVKILHRSPHVNAIFTTHQEKVKDEDSGKLLVSPYFLGKKALGEALKPVDFLWHLDVDKSDKGNPVRILQTQPDGKIDASDRSGKLPMYIEEPTMAAIYEYLSKPSA